ncbi:cyclin-J [Anopheles arabiensis]|nr:cyclin-J [Anopheles arabiensis]
MDRWNTFFNAPYCTEYDEDILETLKECESRRMNVHFISPQLEHRRSSVQLILNVCKQQSYRQATVHLAIYLLDVFMSNHTIAVGRLKLVALTCLYLACKIEENDSSVPSPTRLNGFLANVYRPADFIALEVAILCFFDWHITIPTASTFLDIFAMHSFDQQDWDAVSPPWNACDSMALLVQHINETSSTILEATLLHLKLSTVKPSLLAAGCIAAARCLTPRVSVWSDRLTSATGYEYSQIHEVCQMLLFEAMPQSPRSSRSSLSSSTPKRSTSDAGYLSEWWESENEDENGTISSCVSINSSSSSSSSTSQDSSDTQSCSGSAGSTYRKTCLRSELVLSDTGESAPKKRKMADTEK